MDHPKSVVDLPPTLSQAAISHVQEVVVINSTFNLHQRHNLNPSQPSVDDLQQIPNWLTLTDFSIIQSDTFSKHTIGTGTWLLEHTNFQKWVSSEVPSVLWVKGMVGAGKTILSSIVINHLQTSFHNSEENAAIIFAYCRHSDRNSTPNILASFVKQLAQRHSAVLSLVKSVYMNHCKDGTLPNVAMDILQKSIPLFNRVYIVVDALDEFPDDDRFGFLSALVSLQASLLVTSRPSIASRLFRGKPYIEIGDKNQRDIEFFIEQKIKESTDLTELLGRNEQKSSSEIRAKLKETSDSMFVIASLQIESLKSCTTINELHKATVSVSPDIRKGTYSSTWARIKAQSENPSGLATQAIIWLAYACRPLKISELQHALAVQRDAETFDNNDVSTEEKILSACCGLIVVDRESQIVRFIHFTALDFFRDLGRGVYSTPHTLITKRCISYLSESGLTKRNLKITSRKKLKAFLNVEERPLRDYAYRYWSFHARSCYKEGGLPCTVSDFLEKCGQYPCTLNGTGFDLFKRSHVIAYYGLQGVSSHAERNQRTSIMQFTPLILACTQGNKDNVKELLSHKPSVNTHAKNGHTALYTASLNGHEAVVSLLLFYNEVAINTQVKDSLGVFGSLLHKLVYKVDVNKVGEGGRTSLFAAASKGHTAVVKLLLSRKDINANTRTKDGQTPLFAASQNGHHAVVKLLLSHKGIDVNKQTKDGRTPLFAASQNGHHAVVKLLLNLTHRDIAINKETEHSWTALVTASRNGHEAVVNLLLSRRDIAVDTQTEGRWTALIAASCYGHESIVKLLLRCTDIAVNARKEGGWTALIAASYCGHESIVKLLLRRTDITVNTKTDHGWTALFAASYCGHKAVVKVLLDHTNISVNMQTKHGWTALLAASRNGHDAVVDLLLTRTDIDVDTQTESGWTALIAASCYGYESIVKLLLTRTDIAVNAQTKDGQTALFAASYCGYKAVIDLLLTCTDIAIDRQTVLLWSRTNKGRSGSTHSGCS